jgi:hypothetical protein
MRRTYMVAMFSVASKRGCVCDNCIPIIEVTFPMDYEVQTVIIPGLGKVDVWWCTDSKCIRYGDQEHKPEFLFVERWTPTLGVYASGNRNKVVKARKTFAQLRDRLFGLLEEAG